MTPQSFSYYDSTVGITMTSSSSLKKFLLELLAEKQARLLSAEC